jgi:tRNA(fMet)-specific endonuclease VapC
MNVLDTDSLTLLMHGHPRMTERVSQAEDEVVITVISRIEVLQGRFASVLTAADGEQLLRAQRWLAENESYLRGVTALPIDAAAAAEFDRLRQDRKLKKIGRADLLIACIALAHRAVLVTRNQRHFRQVPGLQLDNWAD